MRTDAKLMRGLGVGIVTLFLAVGAVFAADGFEPGAGRSDDRRAEGDRRADADRRADRRSDRRTDRGPYGRSDRQSHGRPDCRSDRDRGTAGHRRADANGRAA